MEDKNIEKLFKDAFQHFETDVTPKAWATIQNRISTGSSLSSSVGKLATGKIITAGVLVASMIGAISYFSYNYNIDTTSPTENKINTPIAVQNNNESARPVTSSFNNSSDHIVTQKAIQSTKATTLVNSEGNSISTSNSSTSNTSTEGVAIKNDPLQTQNYGSMPQGTSNVTTRSNSATPPTTLSSKGLSTNEIPKQEIMPLANIISNVSSGTVPLTVMFSNQDSSSSLHWDFGDGTFSNESSPTHIYNKPGNYAITLTTKNSAGVATDKINIDAQSISSISKIGNVFSPNMDGNNDFFTFELKNISVFEITIAGRSGELVYKAEDLNAKWDGKLLNGSDAPAGVYFYVIRAIGIDGETIHSKGSITLVR